MKYNTFTQWSFAHDLELEKQGQYGVFQVTRANEKKNCYETNLWRLDVQTGAAQPLTQSGKDGNSHFLNADEILFTSSRALAEDVPYIELKKDASKAKPNEEKNEPANTHTAQNPKDTDISKKEGTTFWKIALHGGEAQPLYKVGLYVHDWESIPQSEDLLLLASPIPEKKDGYTIAEDLPLWFNGSGYLHGSRTGMYILHKDQRLTRLTEATESVDGWTLCPEMHSILYTSITYGKEAMPLRQDLCCINYQTQEKETWIPSIGSVHALHARDEKSAWLLRAANETHGINEDPKLYLLHYEDRKLECLDAAFDRSIYNSVGTDARYGHGICTKATAEHLYFIQTVRGNAHLQRVDANGQVTTLLGGDISVECFDLAGSTFAWIAMKNLDLPEIFLKRDGEAFEKSTPCTHFSEVLRDIKRSVPEKFSFTSNGDTLDGYVVKPIDYDPKKQYPALLSIHGGPKTVFGSVLHHEMQLLAHRGYFIFYTNPHGSDGHGVKFSDIRGKYGTIDYEDLMHFTDLVLERYPAIDSKRLGVLGGSYGGFMTNWIIGHTDRFAAANAQRCISNWLSFYGVSDIGYYFTPDQTAAEPWESTEAAWDASPLKYAPSVTTPTLFIHADEDYRCPLEQGVQMYAALKLRNVPTRLAIFHGENHELSRSGKPKNRIQRLEEICTWFDTYLQGAVREEA